MRFLILILLLTASFTGFAQSANEKKLIATVKEFHQALVQKNTIFIDKQTDKALSYGHSNGWVETKAAIIKDLETGYISYEEIKEDSISISMNKDRANVRFLAVIKATMNGTTNSFKLRVLEVWIKKNYQWILFARQAVKVQ